MKSSMHRIVSVAVAGVALLLASIAPARAAVYSGAWDPRFGTPYNNLFFSVAIQVTVPDYCDPLSETKTVRNASGCGGGATVDSAVVTLQPLSRSSTYSTLNFTSGLTIGDLYFTNGLLTGISTNTTNVKLAGYVAEAPLDTFDLGFGGVPVLTAHHRVCTKWDEDTHVTLGRSAGGGGECERWGWADYTNDSQTYPYSSRSGFAIVGGSVPEPGSAVLMAVALLGLAWVGMGRRQSSRPQR